LKKGIAYGIARREKEGAFMIFDANLDFYKFFSRRARPDETTGPTNSQTLSNVVWKGEIERYISLSGHIF
jgi:hypothetical protein